MSTEVKYAIQDVYPDDFSWCYGCGRLNKEGHQFRTGWDGDKTITIYTPKAEHTAIPGFVYGGLLASLIDCHGTGSASLALHKKNGYMPEDKVEAPRFVTASLQVNFTKPTPQGQPLKAVGTIEEIHPRKYKIHIEVFSREICYASGEVVAVKMPESFGQSS